ncbi:hypothetical protein BDN71DRAFT_284584 [Pleurotus eryngii]|uniref:Uncharacterized protein n=1 Tax=Pleurotus eryngii TaxID=5323 RepID=A0A9P5ZMF7_PLEER|nr:hypothetical protein BDN71DRAFT_284584 [Pleurotus eryngii]
MGAEYSTKLLATSIIITQLQSRTKASILVTNPYYMLYIPRRFLGATPRDIISRIADWASNCGTPTILYLRPYPEAGQPTGGPSTLAQHLSEVGCLDEILAQVTASPETRTSLSWRRISRELTRKLALYREVVAEKLKAREMRLANRPASSRPRDHRSKRRPSAGGLVGLVKSLQELRLAKQREHRVGDPSERQGCDQE